MNWTDALQLHEDAAAGYARDAEALDARMWSAPRAPGRWSPAQITDHLCRVYDVLLDELHGGAGMRIRTRWWQRVLLRLTLMPRLLAGKSFPRGARAPRETRPTDAVDDQTVLVGRFRERAARFHDAARTARESGSRQQLTHAYFGRSTVLDSVVFCARHIQHHHRQLPDGAGPAAG